MTAINSAVPINNLLWGLWVLLCCPDSVLFGLNSEHAARWTEDFSSLTPMPSLPPDAFVAGVSFSRCSSVSFCHLAVQLRAILPLWQTDRQETDSIRGLFTLLHFLNFTREEMEDPFACVSLITWFFPQYGCTDWQGLGQLRTNCCIHQIQMLFISTSPSVPPNPSSPFSSTTEGCMGVSYMIG